MVDAVKEIYIDGERVGYCTGAKASEEVSRSSTQTFDGPVNSGLGNVPWTLEISKLDVGSLEGVMKLEGVMDKMLSEKATVTLSESYTSPEGEKYKKVQHFLNCLVDGNDCEISAEDCTALTLKFAAESRTVEFPEK